MSLPETLSRYCPITSSTSRRPLHFSTVAAPPCAARSLGVVYVRRKSASVGASRPRTLLAYLDGEDPASTTERAAWDAYIRKVVAAAPPLRPEQVAALSALFDWQPAADGGGAR